MIDYTIPLITSAMVQLTDQCNMRCEYCFVNKQAHRMTYGTLLDITNKLIANAEETGRRPGLCFFGGEPLLEWDTLIVPIVNYINNNYGKPFGYSMTTNCTLLDEEKLSFAKDNHFNILFSVDGGETTTSMNRPMASGKNSFPILEEKFKLIARYYPNASARMTIHRKTVERFVEDILYVESKGFREIRAIPNYFDEWSSSELETLKSQIELYGDYLIDAFRKQQSPVVFKQFGEMFYLFIKKNDCIASGGKQNNSLCDPEHKCGFGCRGSCSIKTNGEIYGCFHPGDLTPSSPFYLGNLDIGYKPENASALIEQCRNEPLGGLDCDSCLLKEICDRGCVPNNWSITGKFNTPPVPYCVYKRALAENAARVMQTLGNENNEVFHKAFLAALRRGYSG